MKGGGWHLVADGRDFDGGNKGGVFVAQIPPVAEAVPWHHGQNLQGIAGYCRGMQGVCRGYAGVGVSGLGFGVNGLEMRGQGLGARGRVPGFGFRTWGCGSGENEDENGDLEISGFRVQNLGFRV